MKKKEIITEEQQKIAQFAKAMGHPIRIYVLQELTRRKCCYSGDLSEVLPIAKSTLSQHLKALKNADLIQGEIETPKIRYCLNKKNWKLAQKVFKEFFE